MPGAPVLAIDIGGTKLAAAVVVDGSLLERREVATERAGGPEAWIDAAATIVADWQGCAVAGVAATGLLRDGLWRAVNPDTLPIPDDYPLVAELGNRLGLGVTARNDAQAAAWGEYRFGPARSPNMVFATVSTGIGGGIIAEGRLLEGRAGLAGHIGIAPVATPLGVRKLEDLASGSALARLAAQHGRIAERGCAAERGGPAAVTAAAAGGEAWAGAILDEIVAPLALAICRLQLELDPDLFVIGGGLGLARGYIERLRRHVEGVPALMRPTLAAAALGADAGLIGIADLAIRERTEKER